MVFKTTAFTNFATPACISGVVMSLRAGHVAFGCYPVASKATGVTSMGV